MIALNFLPEGPPPDNAKLKELARKLFKGLPMVRAFEDDYEVAVDLLRRVYNAGRVRGNVEAGPT